jgi:Zn-dependent peptidase ImmA (M78 family)
VGKKKLLSPGSAAADLKNVRLNCIAVLPLGTFELPVYVTTDDPSAELWDGNENLGVYAHLPWVADAVRSVHTQKAWGIFNVAVPCVIVDGRIPASRFRATLLHELGHALEHLLGLDHTEGQANVIGLFLDAVIENVVDVVEEPWRDRGSKK